MITPSFAFQRDVMSQCLFSLSIEDVVKKLRSVNVVKKGCRSNLTGTGSILMINLETNMC